MRCVGSRGALWIEGLFRVGCLRLWRSAFCRFVCGPRGGGGEYAVLRSVDESCAPPGGVGCCLGGGVADIVITAGVGGAISAGLIGIPGRLVFFLSLGFTPKCLVSRSMSLLRWRWYRDVACWMCHKGAAKGGPGRLSVPFWIGIRGVRCWFVGCVCHRSRGEEVCPISDIFDCFCSRGCLCSEQVCYFHLRVLCW